MDRAPRALVIRTAGTNCDAEMCRAFEAAGAVAELSHVDALVRDPAPVDRAALIGFPGGFSYGDDVASGRLLAARLREKLWPALRSAVERGTPMIGVCNGFQVLVQLGLLPGPMRGERPGDRPPAPTLALVDNASATFIDRWVRVEAAAPSACVWTRGLEGLAFDLPIAHAEGRLIARDERTLDALESGGHVALRYAEDVNGSQRRIAGVCDESGRVFGLMPHPERFLEWNRHPAGEASDGETPGLRMFRSAVGSVTNPEPATA
ncbi:MAG: phosphoribosylformylglycinamidine synthase subunit PurQ [Planctomycetota bacterium]